MANEALTCKIKLKYIHLYAPNKVAMYINEQINKQTKSTSKKKQ